MKSLWLAFSALVGPRTRRNLKVLLILQVALVVMVGTYSTVFHFIMEAEGQRYSWVTAIYWTLVTMSTLGFGDITFESDIGRAFSVLVLVSGSVFILVLLPFTFIQFIYVPWIEARNRARAPRALPAETAGHVVLTGVGPIEDALIRRMRRPPQPYVVLVGELDEALRLHDAGYRVMVGAIDDPDTYRAARVDAASLVATTRSDTANTNIAFTVREISEAVPVVATATSAASVDILELAGCDRVLQLGEMLGNAIARRLIAPDGRSHPIGGFGDMVIAEAAAAGTPLVGTSLREANLRARAGVNVVGVWHRGRFEVAGPDSEILPASLLLIAGTEAQLERYDTLFSSDSSSKEGSVVIVGGGRVGRAISRHLTAAGREHMIVERLPERVRDPQRYVIGDAAELKVLHRAGIRKASAVVVTTHDDDVNIYLTLYCRRLRPDVHVMARANLERNVSTLHRAGADFVLSYATMGATEVWNMLPGHDTLVLAEGLDVFRVPVPPALAGKPLAQSGIRERTGCNVIAVAHGADMHGNPDAAMPLPAGGELLVIGDAEAEDRFLVRYGIR